MKSNNQNNTTNYVLVIILSTIYLTIGGCSFFGPSRSELEGFNKEYYDSAIATTEYVNSVLKGYRHTIRSQRAEEKIADLKKYFNDPKKYQGDPNLTNELGKEQFLCKPQKFYGDGGESLKSIYTLGKVSADLLKAEDSQGIPLFFSSIFTDYNVVNYHKDRSSESSTLGDELEKKCSFMIKTWEHEKPTQYEFGVAEIVLIYNGYKALDKFLGLLGTGISDSKKVEAWQAYMNSKETIDGKEVFVVQEEMKQSINTIKKITSRNLDSLTNISVQRFRDSYVVYQSAHQELKEKLNKEIVKPGLSEEHITIKIRNALNGPLLELIEQADGFDAVLDMQKQKPVGDELEKNFKKLIALANDENLTLDRLKNEFKKTKEIVDAGKDAYEQINKTF